MDWSFVATCGPILLVAGLLLGRRPAGRPAAGFGLRRLVAAAAVLVALGGVYSLAAPWLAQRQLASAVTIAAVKKAHSYDPLSTSALLEWGTLADIQGNTLEAARRFTDATALEPESSETWWALGSFYYEHKAWAHVLRGAQQGVAVRHARAGGHALRPARPGAPQGARRLAV